MITNKKDITRAVALGAIWGMFLSGCDSTPEYRADFPIDTLRVVSVHPRVTGRVTIVGVDKNGTKRAGDISVQPDTVLVPERGDTIVAERCSDFIKIRQNLTANRLIREYATRQK